MGVSSLHMPLIRGAHPVVVGESRPPTLEECESIIRHLQYTNDQQSHEVGLDSNAVLNKLYGKLGGLDTRHLVQYEPPID